MRCFYYSSLLLREAAVIFLDQLSRHHNLVSAAHALQAEVCADTHDFPLAAAARMWFFSFTISPTAYLSILYSFSTYICHIIYYDMRVKKVFCPHTTPLSAQIQSPVPAVSEDLLLRPSVWWTC